MTDNGDGGGPTRTAEEETAGEESTERSKVDEAAGDRGGATYGVEGKETDRADGLAGTAAADSKNFTAAVRRAFCSIGELAALDRRRRAFPCSINHCGDPAGNDG